VVSRIVTIAAAAVVGVLAGCGNSTPAPTTTLVENARVDAARYLADSAAGAAAIRSFTAELATVGTPATPARLKAVVPRLDPPLATARLVGQRLSAQRLADRRLEAQRAGDATSFAVAVIAMGQVRTAAASGDPVAARTASQALASALDALRMAATGVS
jgi:hypothetical protein